MHLELQSQGDKRLHVAPGAADEHDNRELGHRWSHILLCGHCA